MHSAHASFHLTGSEEIRASSDSYNHVALWVGGAGEVGLVLPDRNGPEVNAAWLRKLAAAALDLADVTEQREAVTA